MSVWHNPTEIDVFVRFVSEEQPNGKPVEIKVPAGAEAALPNVIDAIVPSIAPHLVRGAAPKPIVEPAKPSKQQKSASSAG